MNSKSCAIVSIAALAMVGACFLLLAPSEAQEQPPQPPPNVFTALEIPDWQDPLLPGDGTILRSRPVTVNFDILGAARPATPGADPPAVPIRFNLFDDVTVTVIFERAKPRYDIEIPDNPMDLLGQEFEPVGYNWLGNIVGEHHGHVILATASNVCAVEINAPDLGTFIVRSFGDVHVVRELGGGADWECGVVATEDSSSQGAGAEGGSVCGIDFVGCDDGSVLDLLVVYTSAARIEAENKGRDIEMEIRDFHFTDANLALSNSQVNTTEFRLVGVVEVDYSGSVNQAKILDPWDGILDEIHALRNALRADLVSVAIAESQGNGAASLMSDEGPLFERSALSHYPWTKGGAPDWTFVHEIAHNLGCTHNRAAPPSPPDCEDNCDCIHGVCYFSWGYLLPPEAPLYDTLMSWEGPGGTVEILHFSNPDVLFRGFPTGEAPPSCDSADNALTIITTRDTVGNFRESCDTTGTTNIASQDWSEGQADDDSFSPSISDNGQWIAFASDATTGWIQGGQDGFSDIYLFNRESGLVKPISRHSSGTGGDSFSPAVSGNGQWIAFASLADNLNGVDPNPNAGSEVYVAWHSSGDLPVRRRVSVSSAEKLPVGDSFSPSISKNGRYVAFESDAENLLDGLNQIPDTSSFRDIFVRDRDGNEDLSFDDPEDSSTARVSLTTAGGEANGGSYAPAISADNGQFVAFESDADNLLATGDTNEVRDIFVRNTAPPGQTFRVSISTAGVGGDFASFAPSISANGLFVVFESDATNLVSGDSNGVRDVFFRDTPSQITFRISDPPGAAEADGASFAPAISADGKFVVFHSDATNLLGEAVDTNGLTDVFMFEIITGTITRVSINSLEQQAVGGGSLAPAISTDGRFIAFESDATNLVPVDAGGYRDIFFRDRGSMCVGDLNGDFVVDAFDLAILLGNWGPVPDCPPHIAPDFNQDCVVEAADLAILLGNWGPCL